MGRGNDKIRVAILGGGLAGVILLRGLIQLDHLDVHIFESRSSFREEGAGIVVGRNAISALDAVDPDLVACLDRAGAVKPKTAHHWIGGGPDAGAYLPEFERSDADDDRFEDRTCYRQAFFSQLLANLPPERMHSSHRLDDIDDSQAITGGRLVLRFDNGVNEDFDVVFGADGVNSKLRKYVLGKHPSAEAQPVGQWHLLQMVPYAEAKEAFGPHLDNSSGDQRCWIGPRNYTMTDWHDDMSTVQLVIASNEHSDELKKEKSKRKVLSHAEFKDLLSGQLPHLSEGVANLVCKHSPEGVTAYCQFAHIPAPTITKGHVCLVGDAAHATSPTQGSGGGMSCEDASILTALLREAKTLERLRHAFAIYDGIRRPRCDRIIASSENMGRVFTGGYGVDKDVVAEALIHDWDHIGSWRADIEIARALELYQSKLEASS